MVISEFLYDAEGADTDQEFVELFNAGTSAVDLTQWKVNDGSNHTLNIPPKNGGKGSIMIAPGGYVLLVDDAAAFVLLHSGVTVGVIDTVLSLTNAAGSILLIDADGSTVDSLSYAKEQGGAADGNSLARTSVSNKTLIAGAPTPGTGSLVQSSGTSNSNSTTSTNTNTGQAQTTQTTISGGESSTFVPPEIQLFADGGSDRTVIVGADTQFVGRAYNKKKEVVPHARLVWNFGDGTTAEGASVAHHYNYPGRYVVVLDIAEAENPASDQFIVTSEKARMTFTTLTDGSVSIENHSLHTLDLSRWIVRQQTRKFPLPAHSLVLAGASMRLSQQTLGFFSDASVELAYPNGIAALRAGESTEGTMPQVAAPVVQDNAPAPVSEESVVAEQEDSVPQKTSKNADDEPAAEVFDTKAELPSQVAAAAATGTTSYIWWLGAVALATLAGGALFVAQRFGKREWAIVEETGETG